MKPIDLKESLYSADKEIRDLSLNMLTSKYDCNFSIVPEPDLQEIVRSDENVNILELLKNHIDWMIYYLTLKEMGLTLANNGVSIDWFINYENRRIELILKIIEEHNENKQ